MPQLSFFMQKLPQASLRNASSLMEGAFGEAGKLSELSKAPSPRGLSAKQTEGVFYISGAITFSSRPIRRSSFLPCQTLCRVASTVRQRASVS